MTAPKRIPTSAALERVIRDARRAPGIARPNQVIDDVLGRGPDALAQVHAQMPANFPRAVAEPIFAGVERALQQLGHGLQ